MSRVLSRALPLFVAVCLTAALLPSTTSTASPRDRRDVPATYTNPLAPRIPGGGGSVDSCADPTVLRGQGRQARAWFMYCTTDPLNDSETAAGEVVFHPVPMMRSTDLVSWTYVGDAVPSLPSWAGPTAFAWAPDVVYSRTQHRYYLSYVVTDTADAVSGEPGCGSDSAIAVATSDSPDRTVADERHAAGRAAARRTRAATSTGPTTPTCSATRSPTAACSTTAPTTAASSHSTSP